MTDNLGARFKYIREKNGFTQKQVAEYLDVDQSYISKFEKGERQLNLSQLDDACILLGCSLEAMLNPDTPHGILRIAMRAKNISEKDLKTIATINRLVLNQQFMEQVLEEANEG